MTAEETPPLPPDADALPNPDPPPREPAAAEPPADGAPAAPPVDAASPDTAGEPAASGAASPAARSRRRRRRRPPRNPGGAPRLATQTPLPEAAAVDTGAIEVRPDAEPASGEGVAVDQTQGGAADAATGRPRRHRRRRRPFGGFRTAPAPGALGSALPPSDGGEAAPEESDGAAGPGGSSRPTLHLRRPVRGRRQLSRPPGLQPGAGGSALADGASLQPETSATPDGAPVTEGGGAAARPANELPRRRRRRRPAPRAGDTAPSAEGQAAAPGSQTAGRARPPRDRYRRDSAGAAAGAPRVQGPQDRGPGRARRDDAERARGRGPGGPRGREAPRPVERKLYASEALVDRGFEDVPDDAEENGSRRVHWTIVKRSVADQKSGKAMSATYVLQREGDETEFANLGAARAAANKTIVHPEKLTMSKAEHAAEHAAAKNTR